MSAKTDRVGAAPARLFWISTLGLATAAPCAWAQWTDDPSVNTPVVLAAMDQDAVKLGIGDDGSTWVGWFDFQPGGIELRVQRLDEGGQAVFPAGGLLVSDNPQSSFVVDWDLGVDSAGNCMLVFADTRAGADFDIYAYLISPAGAMLWGSDGVVVSDNEDFEADPRIIQNALGDYIVVWPRFDLAPGLYVQRLNAAGVPQLAPGGVRFQGDGSAEPAFAEIIGLPDGEFVCSYVRDSAMASGARYVDVGRYTPNGALSANWNGNPLAISVVGTVPVAHRPRIIADPINAAIVAWHDDRDGDFDCYIQMITANGGSVFQPGGRPVSIEPGRQQLDPAIAVDPNTRDIMIAYRNTDAAQSTFGLNIQRIDRSNASRVFGDSGLELMPFDNQYDAPPSIAPCQGGVATLVATQPGSSGGDSRSVLRVLRVQAAGTLIDSGPIDACTVLSEKSRLAIAETPDHGSVAAWADDRNTSLDVYAQRINPDGSLGLPDCVVDLAEPYGVLDFSDVIAFLFAFAGMAPEADLAAPTGVFDFSDVLAFLIAYAAGCP